MTVKDLRNILAHLPSDMDVRLFVNGAEEMATFATRIENSLMLCSSIDDLIGGEVVLYDAGEFNADRERK